MSRRPTYRTQAIVLRSWRLGEADRILSLLTRDHGKLRAVAKGVRKTKSRYGALLEPANHVELMLYPGRELDTVTQVSTLDRMAHLREDLERISRASIMLETAEYVAIDREPQPELYQLVLGALRTLDAGDRPLLLAGFLFKLLVAEGVGPALGHCTGCGTTEELVAIDAATSGARCRRCRGGTPLPPDGFGLLQLMTTGRLGLALQEPASYLTQTLENLATSCMEHHLERPLRSAARSMAPTPVGWA